MWRLNDMAMKTTVLDFQPNATTSCDIMYFLILIESVDQRYERRNGEVMKLSQDECRGLCNSIGMPSVSGND